MATEQLETLGTEDAKWLGEYSQVHMNVFGTPLRVMDHGEGAHIWDVDGNEYLDFLAGIAVNALGYAHPKWVKAASEQADKAAQRPKPACRKPCGAGNARAAYQHQHRVGKVVAHHKI